MARRQADNSGQGSARISRRAFVRGAVAVGAGTAAGLPLGRTANAEQLRIRRRSKADVVVIGAGLAAGLTAARTPASSPVC